MMMVDKGPIHSTTVVLWLPIAPSALVRNNMNSNIKSAFMNPKSTHEHQNDQPPPVAIENVICSHHGHRRSPECLSGRTRKKQVAAAEEYCRHGRGLSGAVGRVAGRGRPVPFPFTCSFVLSIRNARSVHTMCVYGRSNQRSILKLGLEGVIVFYG
ncbi:hypothetical protein E3N88_35073 [Mikania micrantha]|uniref:Uncharacterized protein n=1 Tax=Mikania micrantha TaxID=192012 RepID=A0A5N6M2Q9_9ASTR|nr:hypothetical protein E3N88_35073 [Mikania micrantha]